jgi:hypothetical protein
LDPDLIPGVEVPDLSAEIGDHGACVAVPVTAIRWKRKKSVRKFFLIL